MILRKTVLLSTFVVFFFALPAFSMLADLAPSWRRQDRTTYQSWTFDDGANPVTIANEAGSSTATINVGQFGTGWWYNELELGTQTTGYWDIGGTDGSIILDIDNFPDGEYKLISLQITYYEAIGGAPTVDMLPVAELLEEQIVEVDWDEIGTWYLWQSTWMMEPNPDFEQIILIGDPAGSIIDQIIVDTICVPEPASLGLLMLGGLTLLKKKK